MSRLKLLLKSFVLLLSISIGSPIFAAFAAEQTIEQQDALQQFRVLLSKQLNPSRASIERVFNPIGEGEALLVRTYHTGLQELVFRPLIDIGNHLNGQENNQDSFILRTLPNTELNEVLISFDQANSEYQIYFGQFHYSVDPDLSATQRLRVSPDVLPFLTRNFQTLFIDQPLIALATQYLLQQQYLLDQPAILQLKKEYRDSITGQLLVNGDGDIINRYRFSLYNSIPIQPIYFIEQSPFGSIESTRYYIQDNGLQSYRIDQYGQKKPTEWLSLQQIKSSIENTYNLDVPSSESNKASILD